MSDDEAPWRRAALLSAVLLAIPETSFIAILAPLARPPLTLALLFLVQAALLVLLAAPLAGGLALAARLVPSVRLPEPRHLLPALTGAVLALMGLRGAEAAFVNYGAEFQDPVSLVFDAVRLGVLVVVIALTWLVLTPGFAWIIERAPRLQDARTVCGSVLALGALYGSWVLGLGFAPANVFTWRGTAAVATATVALLAARCLDRGRRRLPAGRLLVGVLAAGALIFFVDGAVRSLAFARASTTTVPLVGLSLIGDLDRDGALANYLGGYDCAPFDGERGPAAQERPGDGLDQDCDGEDRAVTRARARRPDAGPWQRCLEREDGRWSVLLVTVDALRADHLSLRLVPALQTLAKRSAWFTSASAQATRTSESLPVLFGGRYASDPAPAEQRTFVSAFQRAGYKTFAVTGLDPRLGPMRSKDWPEFDEVTVSYGDAATVDGKFAFTSFSQTEATLAQLAKLDAGAPFFGWVHYLDPHAPYLRIDPERMPEPAGTRYEREIAYTYLQVDRLLVSLARSEHAPNTVVVFTADHGEDLGEHGREGHGGDVFAGSIHVPLAVYVPGCPGVLVEEPVGLVDISGTLGLITRVETWSEPYTLLDAVAGTARGWPLVSEAWPPIRGHIRGVLDGPRKLVVDLSNGGRTLLVLDGGLEREMNAAERAEHGPRLDERHATWRQRPLAQPIELPTIKASDDSQPVP